MGSSGEGRASMRAVACARTRALAVVLTSGFLAMPAGGAGAQALQPITQAEPASAKAQLCAASGEQILAGNMVRAAVYQEQFSRYNSRTSRCFVEMRVLTMAADEQADRVGSFLYDGQTQELLAFAEIRNGKKSGRVFDLNHQTRSFDNSGWDDANDYIYTMMAGDW